MSPKDKLKKSIHSLESRIEKESISALLSVYTQLKSKGVYVEIKGPQKIMLNLFKQYDIDDVIEK